MTINGKKRLYKSVRKTERTICTYFDCASGCDRTCGGGPGYRGGAEGSYLAWH